MSQIYHRREKEKLVLLVTKSVDDLSATGPGSYAKQFIQTFDKTSKLGTVNYGPEHSRVIGINFIQNTEFTIEKHAKVKLGAVLKYFPTRPRRKEYKGSINQMEISKFAPVNSTLRWLGVIATTLCALFSSYL